MINPLEIEVSGGGWSKLIDIANAKPMIANVCRFMNAPRLLVLNMEKYFTASYAFRKIMYIQIPIGRILIRLLRKKGKSLFKMGHWTVIANNY